MESLWKSSSLTAIDLDNFKFEVDPVRSQPSDTKATGIYSKSSLLKAQGQQDWLAKTERRLEKEWKNWLDDAVPLSVTAENHFALVVFPRPNPKSVRRENILDFPRLWKYLPISRSSFKTIAERLNLHRAIVVLLDLGAPVISRIVCKKNNEEYKVYSLRFDHGLEHQAAMTITHFPKPPAAPPGQILSGSKTSAIILGYDDSDIEKLLVPLEGCKNSIFCPFTLIKAFLHVERQRRFKEVNHKIAMFQSILQNYGRLPVGEEDSGQTSKGGNSQDPKDLIGMYISVCTLKNQLTAWRTQIVGLKGFVGDFEGPVGEQVDIDPAEYLQRLVDEYELKIDKCDMVLQGASLAFQMETAHLSRLDAQNAMRDGKQMKAIAVLTMVFLPGTFIATLMAIPEFEAMKLVSGFPAWSWYLILFFPLTAVVLGAYVAWTNLYISKDQKTLRYMV